VFSAGRTQMGDNPSHPRQSIGSSVHCRFKWKVSAPKSLSLLAFHTRIPRYSDYQVLGNRDFFFLTIRPFGQPPHSEEFSSEWKLANGAGDPIVTGGV
jgi:hypothetical protein